MAAGTRYFALSTADTYTLIAKGRKIDGNTISEILISNYDSTNTARLILYLDNPTGTNYTILSTQVRPFSSLVLNDKTMLQFDSSIYNLKLTKATGATITVIIK